MKNCHTLRDKSEETDAVKATNVSAFEKID